MNLELLRDGTEPCWIPFDFNWSPYTFFAYSMILHLYFFPEDSFEDFLVSTFWFLFWAIFSFYMIADWSRIFFSSIFSGIILLFDFIFSSSFWLSSYGFFPYLTVFSKEFFTNDAFKISVDISCFEFSFTFFRRSWFGGLFSILLRCLRL